MTAWAGAATLAAAAGLAAPSLASAHREDDTYRAACRAWSRHVMAVMQQRAATGTLDERAMSMHVETLENLAGRCWTAEARATGVLLQRLNDYLVNERNQP